MEDPKVHCQYDTCHAESASDNRVPIDREYAGNGERDSQQEVGDRQQPFTAEWTGGMSFCGEEGPDTRNPLTEYTSDRKIAMLNSRTVTDGCVASS